MQCKISLFEALSLTYYIFVLENGSILTRWEPVKPVQGTNALRSFMVSRSTDPWMERCWKNMTTEAVPDMLARTQVQAISMDGHEKVIAKCADNPPARSGRPRKDGHIKMSHSG